MKAFWRNIHLYLSLAAGLVIMVVCLTGAVLVFEKEFQQVIYPERYFVEPAAQRIELDSVINGFQTIKKGVAVSGIKLYSHPSRTIEISYAEKTEQTDRGRGDIRDKRQERPKNKLAFINPYSGSLITTTEGRSGFFFAMFSLHRWLLMGDTGKLIVGISTSIFLFIIITGLILWWPKTKAKLKQHLTLKWAGWKRINHDLHVVIGFYTAIFLFAFAFTGLAWSFQWFNNGIYWITGTENVRAEPPTSYYQANAGTVSYEQIYLAVVEQVNDVIYYQINAPKDSLSVFSVTVMAEDAIHERASDQYYFDQYTGKLTGTALYEDRNLGQRVRSTFYPIHVGSIGGMPGRIIAFLSCAAGFTFPITGVIMWLNRLKKKKRSKKNVRSKKTAISETFKQRETIL